MLSSIGLSDSKNEIQKRFNIDKSFLEENKFYLPIWLPSGLYPSVNLYPNINLYPDSKPYKFLVLNFKLYQKVAEEEATYDDISNGNKMFLKYTGDQYFEAIPLENLKGKADFNICYEREK